MDGFRVGRRWVLGAGLAAATPLRASDLPSIRVGVLAYGTAQWEMKVIRDRGLDVAHGVEMEVRDLGSDDAGDVAVLGGQVDVILTDYIWVSIQRNRGRDLTLVPHSRAVGGLLVNPGAGIATLDDLPGRTIGIAGGPLDKSWIILQALWAQTRDRPLAELVEARFAAPPLVNELLQAGKLDAGLNFWHWNARSKAAGMVELLSVDAMLRQLDLPPEAPLLGWAFHEATAQERPAAVAGFVAASRAAKRLMREDDAVWDGLRGLMKAEGDDALFRQLRDDYRAGIITATAPETADAAALTFAAMARYGGRDLVGEGATLAPGTFWTGDAGN